MIKFFSAFLFGFLVSASAFAQQYGTHLYNNNTHSWMPPSTQQHVIAHRMVPIYHVAPTGYAVGNHSQCGGLLERLGRVIGADRHNDMRHTEIGGFLGYLSGEIFCPRAALYPQAITQQVVPHGKVNRPGHCRIGGVDYPHLVDNEANCKAKYQEILGQGTASQEVSLGNGATNIPAAYAFSNEAVGAGVCRLRSDGSARLKADPSQVTSRGQVLAVAEKTSDQGSAQLISASPGEDCATWRRRVANQIVWKG